MAKQKHARKPRRKPTQWVIMICLEDFGDGDVHYAALEERASRHLKDEHVVDVVDPLDFFDAKDLATFGPSFDALCVLATHMTDDDRPFANFIENIVLMTWLKAKGLSK